MSKGQTMFILTGLLLLLITFVFFQDSRSTNVSEFEEVEFIITSVFPDLSFKNPVGFYTTIGFPNSAFIVEQGGIIYKIELNASTQQKDLFLDLTNEVLSGGELGLLGFAFHPNFIDNGYFFVDYTASNPQRTVVSRFKMSESTPSYVNLTSEKIILDVEQPYTNHNGGQIAFGPDNYLYIALGDGGSGGDPLNNGQNLNTLLGSILRIDVDTDTPYIIPKDNPFFNNSNGFREEIYAYGLRNPWRFSFDFETNTIWAGDVGQNRIEEIDIIESGKNYGWKIMEGSECYSPSSDCNQTGLTQPIFEYGHDVGNSITGGFVYRGNSTPALNGYYIYADYVSGRIWALKYKNYQVENYLVLDTNKNIVSFGVDHNNELFICAFDGKIYTLEETIKTPNFSSDLLTTQTTFNPLDTMVTSSSTTLRFSTKGFFISEIVFSLSIAFFVKKMK